MLDNQSTTYIFFNLKYLSNTHQVNSQMTIHTNGGSLTTSQKGTLAGYGEVWYHPGAMTNILSMSNVKKQYCVTYDSEGVDRFTVHKPEQKVHFNCSPRGLYYHDFTNRDCTLVNTGEDNKTGFSSRKIAKAYQAF